MWAKINTYYPPWLELIPPLLLCLAFAYTISNYPALPGQFPTHFGISGLPDAWKPKGFWPVYLDLMIGTVVWISLLLMNYFFIIKPDDPGKYINISQRQKEQLGPAKLEAIRRTTARGIIIINLTITAMISILHFESIKTALGLQNSLSFMIHVFGAALLIEAIGLTIKTIGMTFTPKVHR